MKRNFLTLAAAGVVALGGFAVAQPETGHDGGARWRGHGFALERLTEGLNLTPDEQAKVQPIIDQAKPQIAAIHREAMQKMKAVMDSTTSQIRPLLTPEQQKKFDTNQKAHPDMINAHKEPHEATQE
jgi:Spy/CpxP family protein refolding chaperone